MIFFFWSPSIRSLHSSLINHQMFHVSCLTYYVHVCVCLKDQNGSASESLWPNSYPMNNKSGVWMPKWIHQTFIDLLRHERKKKVIPLTSSGWFQFNTRGKSKGNEYSPPPQFIHLLEFNIYNNRKKALRSRTENLFSVSLSRRTVAGRRLKITDVWVLRVKVTHLSLLIHLI